MASPFHRTLRALEEERTGRVFLPLGAAALLALLWGAWFVRAGIAVHVASLEARVEADQPVYPIEAQVAGRLLRSHLALGREVTLGEILVELDTTTEERLLEEERARLGALVAREGSVGEALGAEREALASSRLEGTAGLDEAQARLHESEASAGLAADQQGRLEALAERGLISPQDLARARSTTEERRAARDAARAALARARREAEAADGGRRGRLAELEAEHSRLAGERSASATAVSRLEHEVERRHLRATAAGRLADVATLQAGAFVEEGTRLGAIVAVSPLRIVAYFAPPDALGRVRPGQPARLRLDGFPWPAHGSPRASVTSVASEARDGRIRAELELEPDPAPRVTLAHGLTGTVEVEVERATPAALLLRATGRLLARPTRPGPR